MDEAHELLCTLSYDADLDRTSYLGDGWTVAFDRGVDGADPQVTLTLHADAIKVVGEREAVERLGKWAAKLVFECHGFMKESGRAVGCADDIGEPNLDG
ncbi:MAG: hypothetical protein ACYDAY_02090 [Candidatus Dormibacteria bacterium]